MSEGISMKRSCGTSQLCQKSLTQGGVWDEPSAVQADLETTTAEATEANQCYHSPLT